MSNLPEDYPVAVGVVPMETFDLGGERSERTWITRERALEEQLAEIRAERDHLRLMLELALTRDRGNA